MKQQDRNDICRNASYGLEFTSSQNIKKNRNSSYIFRPVEGAASYPRDRYTPFDKMYNPKCHFFSNMYLIISQRIDQQDLAVDLGSLHLSLNRTT